MRNVMTGLVYNGIFPIIKFIDSIRVEVLRQNISVCTIMFVSYKIFQYYSF